MGVRNISGRKAEIIRLQQALFSANPYFIDGYERCRVGKNSLVGEFFDNTLCSTHHDTTQFFR